MLTQSEHLKNELHEHLRQFLPHKRMSTENEQLLHSVYKEFHSGGRYCKGKSAEFSSWMLEHHPRAFYMHIERGWWTTGRSLLVPQPYTTLVNPTFLSKAFTNPLTILSLCRLPFRILTTTSGCPHLH